LCKCGLRLWRNQHQYGSICLAWPNKQH
jgi:hypothetical protein